MLSFHFLYRLLFFTIPSFLFSMNENNFFKCFASSLPCTFFYYYNSFCVTLLCIYVATPLGGFYFIFFFCRRKTKKIIRMKNFPTNAFQLFMFSPFLLFFFFFCFYSHQINSLLLRSHFHINKRKDLLLLFGSFVQS